jgi:hypothetical protein
LPHNCNKNTAELEEGELEEKRTRKGKRRRRESKALEGTEKEKNDKLRQ